MVDGNYRRRLPQGIPLRLRAAVRLIDAAAQLACLAIDARWAVHRWTGGDPKARTPRRRR